MGGMIIPEKGEEKGRKSKVKERKERKEGEKEKKKREKEEKKKGRRQFQWLRKLVENQQAEVQTTTAATKEGRLPSQKKDQTRTISATRPHLKHQDRLHKSSISLCLR